MPWSDSSEWASEEGVSLADSERLRLLEKALDAVCDAVTVSIRITRPRTGDSGGQDRSETDRSFEQVVYRNKAAEDAAVCEDTGARPASYLTIYNKAEAWPLHSENDYSELHGLDAEPTLASSASLHDNAGGGKRDRSGSGPCSSAITAVRVRMCASVSPLHNPCLRAVLNSSPLGVFTTMPDARVEWAAMQLERSTGRSLKEMVGIGWMGNVHPDDLPLALRAREEGLTTGVFPDIEVRLRHPTDANGDSLAGQELAGSDEDSYGSDNCTDDAAAGSADGREAEISSTAARLSSVFDEQTRHMRAHAGPAVSGWRWYLCSCKAMRDPHTGQILRWIGILCDVHKRRLLEQNLAAEKALFLTAIDQLPVSVVVVDAPTGAVRLANQRTFELFRTERLAASFAEYDRFYAFHSSDGRRFKPEDWPISRSVMRGEVIVKEDVRFKRG